MNPARPSPDEVKPEELLIAIIARLLEGCRLVAAGASSPIPGGGCLLARRQSGGAMHVNILGSRANNLMTNGGVELFDWAGQGRLDAFFLGGGQIDGQANINLVGTGDYPNNDIRWPGSFGSAYLYYLVPRVILFREEHSRRVFVPKVDFVSTPGTSGKDIYRTGGPYAMVTPLCLMGFDTARARFHLKSVHPGHTVEEVRDNTGFDFDVPDDVPETVLPDRATLDEIRRHVSLEIAETYPRFAQRVFPEAMQAA
ncbi:CoA-transferase [Minwuia thermotolerans]|uniref:CoA synthetase n=1 Tax=Minwuia thermotolerans TaxID=2056226 RepID=A0A2M9FWG9_9PROT|nr:CoA-transferase [Minwuia thermotolerans]PJK27793.1 CoA synthetase [Minwuia thermotolerans]